MKQQHAKTGTLLNSMPSFVQALDTPAGDLEALHAGLTRRMTSLRAAHDAATARINSLIERTDVILERFAQKH